MTGGLPTADQRPPERARRGTEPMLSRPTAHLHGLTLMELMLVVAIIGILAMLVVPNLMTSRSASNETAAIASLRVYAVAQVVFRTNDRDNNGLAEYAADFRDLYYLLDATGDPIKLVVQNFADANAPDSALSGYYFENLTSSPTGAYDHQYDFGLAALPAKYNQTGVNTMVVDCLGTVYQKDRRTGELLGGQYPDVESDGWLVSGQ